jgi:hypothetical protein
VKFEVGALTKSEEELKKILKDHIDRFYTFYDVWFVGVCDKPEERLLEEHKVDEDEVTWIYDLASDPNDACRVGEYFIQILGTDGNIQDEDESPKAVYAYMKRFHTEP